MKSARELKQEQNKQAISDAAWRKEVAAQQVASVVDNLKKRNIPQMERRQFRDMLSAQGVEVEPTLLGRILSNLGVGGKSPGGNYKAVYTF